MRHIDARDPPRCRTWVLVCGGGASITAPVAAKDKRLFAFSSTATRPRSPQPSSSSSLPSSSFEGAGDGVRGPFTL